MARKVKLLTRPTYKNNMLSQILVSATNVCQQECGYYTTLRNIYRNSSITNAAFMPSCMVTTE